MSKTMNSQSMRAPLCAALVLAGAFAGQIVAWGGEPARACPVQECMRDCCPSTFLTKIPYVGRLFTNAPPCTEMAYGDGLERIGIEFEVGQSIPAQWLFGAASDDCQKCFALEVTACKAECKPCGCSAKQCASEQRCAQSCDLAACEAAKCCANKCCADKCGVAKCGPSKCEIAECDVVNVCPAAAIWAGPQQHPLIAHIIELSSEKAELEAALAVQEAMHEQKVEVLEAFAELAAEKAKLEAQQELQSERDGVVSKMLELAGENARLKSQLELADAKAAFIQQVTQISLENEHLKLQVAQLKLKAESDETRVSKRSPNGRKAR